MNIRDISKDYAEYIPISSEDKRELGRYKYSKCLKIVLHGEPFADSRPKANMKTGGIMLKNQNEMKKSFGMFYKECDILKKLTITSVYHIKCKLYLPITKVDYKKIKDNKMIMNMFKNEMLGHLGEKDIDNMIKIHNDIMLFPEFRISITDGFNVGILKTEKYLSENPRCEMYIYFNDKESNPYYREKITTNAHYYLWQLSSKNWLYQSNRDIKQQLKHMKKVINEIFNKKNVNVKSKVKEILKELTFYKADDLKMLASVDKENKMNRMDTEFKLGLILFKDIPKAYELIQQGGTRLNDTIELQFE